MAVIETPVAGRPAVPGPDPPFALSVDVEDYYQVEAFARVVPRDEWDRFPSRVERNTDALLDLFDETGQRGTFFTLGWIARRQPALVKRIAARGHEVASHGMSHRMLTELTPALFQAEARDSKALLEDLSGTPVTGFRAPSYSVGEGTLWALEVLAGAGYTYDSSIYPIRRGRYGYPAGPLQPVRMSAGSHGSIAEFPMPTVPFGPIRMPVLAGAYLRLFPRWVSLAATRWHRDRGLPFVANVHPWEIDPAQPTIGRSRLAAWTHYARLGRTEGTLRAVLRSAQFAPVAVRLRELGLLAGDAAPGAAAS